MSVEAQPPRFSDQVQKKQNEFGGPMVCEQTIGPPFQVMYKRYVKVTLRHKQLSVVDRFRATHVDRLNLRGSLIRFKKKAKVGGPMG